MQPKIAVGILVVLLLSAPSMAPELIVTVLDYAGLFSLVAIGLALLTGIGGMTSFGQAAFVGVGAYATAYLCTKVDMSPWLTLIIGMGVTGVVAIILGSLTLRLAGHYLPLSTIAWGLSLYFLAGNVEALGGHTGISSVPVIEAFGFPFDSGRRFLYLVWACVGLAAWLTQNLLSSREGRAIRCLRGGRVMGEAMGVDIPRTKLAVFFVSALLASLSGWLYAHFQRFVNPTPFGLDYGIEYLFMTVVGGAGYVWGAVLGATVITALKEGLVDLSPYFFGQVGNVESIVLAIVTIILLQRSPEGLWPKLTALFPSRSTDEKAVEISDDEAMPRRTLPKPGTTLLQVVDATKRFGGLVAVNEVSFETRSSEILALLGPNGAGKSTLFNLISAAAPATAGEVKLLGRAVTRSSAHKIAGMGLSRTFQHVRLLPHLTVLENVAIGCHLRGHAGLIRSALHLERNEEGRLLAEASRQVDRVGLGSQKYTLAGNLPLGGQRVLEIARALSADPMLILLDEPAAGLRLKEKEALAELLRKLRAEGLGILLVEHDMNFVMGLVDRIVVMEFGKKIAEGTPAEIQTNPLVLEAYLGSDA